MKNLERSRQLFEEARRCLPGGVDSPVRAFKAVGGNPPFISRGKGSHLFDADGNEYIDYVCSWGPLILGHAYPQVIAAIQKAAENGTTFGASTECEIELARLITGAMPNIEMIRFVNSGTEATMTALRLARAFTRRDKTVKFAGCYHGHSDGLLTKGGSGMATLGIPDSPGVPADYARNTLVASYNSLDSVEKLYKEFPQQIASIIVEPVAANMGVTMPKPGFLDGLRRITSDSGSLLIFDEVITGFRVGWGGAQTHFSIKPDLTCLGKIIGGGLPVGAYGGRREIMEMIAPSGPVYQAGTLSGNPLVMTAGIETLKILGRPGVYGRLEKKAAALAGGIAAAATKAGVTVQVPQFASLLTVFFTAERPTDWESAKIADTARFARFFHGLLERGVYWPPAQFEASFVSLAHTDADIKATVEAAAQAFKDVS